MNDSTVRVEKINDVSKLKLEIETVRLDLEQPEAERDDLKKRMEHKMQTLIEFDKELVNTQQKLNSVSKQKKKLKESLEKLNAEQLMLQI